MKKVMMFVEFLNETVTFDTSTTGRKDWDDILEKEPDRFHKEVIEMSPDEFLKRVQYRRFTVDDKKVDGYKSRDTVMPTPTMWFTDESQFMSNLSPSWHDGSHRVLALKSRGIDTISVLIVYEKSEVNEAFRKKQKRMDPKERRRMIQSGEAMKDGSFPISSTQDVINAIKLVGLAHDVSAAQAHIIKRAKELFRDDLIPKFWNKAA